MKVRNRIVIIIIILLLLLKKNKNVRLFSQKTHKLDNSEESEIYFTKQEYSGYLLKIYRKFLDLGIYISKFYSPIAANCVFELNSTYLIAPDSKMYFCTSSDSTEMYKIGDLQGNGIIRFQENKTEEIINARRDECKNCIMYPQCLGGCKYLITKNMEECVAEKYILKEIIKLYYDELLKIEEEVMV